MSESARSGASEALTIAVLGAGAWGTALAVSFARKHAVRLWGRDRALMKVIAETRCNDRYLPGTMLPGAVVLSADIGTVLEDASLAVVATPVNGLRAALGLVARHRPTLPCIWVCKGLEAASALLPHQVAVEVMKTGAPYGALLGPSFAEEVAAGLPTALSLASADIGFARETARALHQPTLRVYYTDDVVGAEIGGAVKNVMAIATGVCEGLGLGLNARAALITRGLAEISRLGMAMGGRAETLMGLTGAGDLILTCTGQLSRNRRVGLELAQGKSLAVVLAELGHVAEGVNTAREVARLARERAIEMPITEAVCAVLFEGVHPKRAVERLLARDPRVES
jgi:glycerol-3-phosphate dehydrogenase (NAD(P)+)